MDEIKEHIGREAHPRTQIFRGFQLYSRRKRGKASGLDERAANITFWSEMNWQTAVLQNCRDGLRFACPSHISRRSSIKMKIKMNDWLFRLSVACLLSFGMSDLCAAQTRTMNSNTPGLLRSWPPIDSWQVVLVRTDDNRLTCMTLTGQNTNSILLYLFGIEEDNQHLYLILADQNPDAVSGNSVKVLIDNTLVGTYSVDKRKSAGLLTSIRARIPPADAAKLLNLLKVGGTIQLGSDEATYSASLDGMTAALDDVQSCLVETQGLGSSN